VSGTVNSNRLQILFTYDYMGRRLEKTVYAWNGSAFGTSPVRQTCYVYDGWSLKAELTGTLALQRAYTWGKDLSGSVGGANGIGGLIGVKFYTNAVVSVYGFAAYDGNGNVMALVNAADKSLAARYEYSPFGELLRTSGQYAHLNPIRFSSKYNDEESSLIYYGYRYYNPATGKWLNRDPYNGRKQEYGCIGTSKAELQPGGLNLYGFVANRPLAGFDPDGRSLDDLIHDITDIANTIGWLNMLEALSEIGSLEQFLAPEYLGELLKEYQEAAQAMAIGNAAVNELKDITAETTALSHLGYAGTLEVLISNPTLAYTDASAFTGYMMSGAGDAAGQNAAFEAWMDYVSDPNTP
jgi:RHS repeat-associated protein